MRQMDWESEIIPSKGYRFWEHFGTELLRVAVHVAQEYTVIGIQMFGRQCEIFCGNLPLGETSEQAG
jgi:hypothetical protein